jgi:hypothetical protein
MSAQEVENRFIVNAGVTEAGEPFIEIVDNLAMQRIQMDLILAMNVAGGIGQLCAMTMAEMRKQAVQQQQPKIVVSGDPRLMRVK